MAEPEVISTMSKNFLLLSPNERKLCMQFTNHVLQHCELDKKVRFEENKFLLVNANAPSPADSDQQKATPSIIFNEDEFPGGNSENPMPTEKEWIPAGNSPHGEVGDTGQSTNDTEKSVPAASIAGHKEKVEGTADFDQQEVGLVDSDHQEEDNNTDQQEVYPEVGDKGPPNETEIELVPGNSPPLVDHVEHGEVGDGGQSTNDTEKSVPAASFAGHEENAEGSADSDHQEDNTVQQEVNPEVGDKGPPNETEKELVPAGNSPPIADQVEHGEVGDRVQPTKDTEISVPAASIAGHEEKAEGFADSDQQEDNTTAVDDNNKVQQEVNLEVVDKGPPNETEQEDGSVADHPVAIGEVGDNEQPTNETHVSIAPPNAAPAIAAPEIAAPEVAAPIAPIAAPAIAAHQEDNNPAEVPAIQVRKSQRLQSKGLRVIYCNTSSSSRKSPMKKKQNPRSPLQQRGVAIAAARGRRCRGGVTIAEAGSPLQQRGTEAPLQQTDTEAGSSTLQQPGTEAGSPLQQTGTEAPLQTGTEAPLQQTRTEAPLQQTRTEAPLQQTRTEAPLQQTRTEAGSSTLQQPGTEAGSSTLQHPGTEMDLGDREEVEVRGTNSEQDEMDLGDREEVEERGTNTEQYEMDLGDREEVRGTDTEHEQRMVDLTKDLQEKEKKVAMYRKEREARKKLDNPAWNQKESEGSGKKSDHSDKSFAELEMDIEKRKNVKNAMKRIKDAQKMYSELGKKIESLLKEKVDLHEIIRTEQKMIIDPDFKNDEMASRMGGVGSADDVKTDILQEMRRRREDELGGLITLYVSLKELLTVVPTEENRVFINDIESKVYKYREDYCERINAPLNMKAIFDSFSVIFPMLSSVGKNVLSLNNDGETCFLFTRDDDKFERLNSLRLRAKNICG